MVDLAVVIPTLNEAATLPALLAQLKRQQGVVLDVIVADGGSTDATADIGAQHGARVVRGPRGRGAQMNAGAAAASAPVLLFLHADSQFTTETQLRDALDALVAEAERRGAHVAGHFTLRFARTAPGRDLFYRYVEAKTALNRPGTINGDQGVLLRAGFFRELGGFDERLPFLEDQRLAAKVFARGRWLTLPAPLVTSARRFEREGALRRYTLMSLIMGMHAAQAEEFFARAPEIYATQDRTARLRLLPHLVLAWRVLIDAEFEGALRILYRAGRYTRQNSWQLFFWCDVALRRERRPFLRCHDALVRPLIANPVGDAITAVLIAAWFLALLPVVYAVLDARR